MKSEKALVWFRTDLRIEDNPALSAACQHYQQVEAVFIATPAQWQQHQFAPIQSDFIFRRLQVLRQALAARGIPLHIQECDDFAAVPATIATLCRQQGIAHLFCNKEYPINEKRRDQQVIEQLQADGVKFSGFDEQCILPPGTVLNGRGEIYRVFTPFRKAWLRQLALVDASPLPAPQAVKGAVNANADEVTWAYPRQDSRAYAVLDEEISQQLTEFCQQRAQQYRDQRDFPAVNGTSGLSPYLAIGALSARQCLASLQLAFPECRYQAENGPFTWLSELVWREFYKHLLDAHPELCMHRAFTPWTDRVVWDSDEGLLKAWQEGRTGYPIVDAAMRQLNQTGWMHNRLRMIVASFLTKDLLIDWRHGEAYFSQKLIDCDFASNNGGWQWAASTGTDAQPYFRVFNPTTQGQRFDPEGEFIRKWIKELENCPPRYCHQPEKWSDFAFSGYPTPVVDHAKSRLEIIDRFKFAKQQVEAEQCDG
uniref:deoxyribodipyrimidine photo-lyase n=1 Tax=Thaumasiovibrio occultus TaxID=1891184 RepID=UPI000B35232E|nr:deoxyribodipyrimidine photo-lyase [Thaumasiovibrio occultus]